MICYPDVSHYDWDRNGGNLNWQALSRYGIVMIRASYGDPEIYAPATRYFREMADGAKAAGLFVGGYHNLIHGDRDSISRQVEYFRSELDSVDADWAMVDVEPYSALRKNNLYPRIEDALAFAELWSEVDDRPLGIYLAKWVWDKWLGTPDLAPLMTIAGGPLINANYSGAGGWEPYGNVTPTVLQYTSTEIIPDKIGVTDMNMFDGTVEQFVSLFDLRGGNMAWELVPNLLELREQLNRIAPNRDKASDGTIGDYTHSQSKSSHNPDDTGRDNAEWDSDPDGREEVRAIDLDIDFRVPGLTGQLFVDHLVKYAKNGTFWWLRYVIYNRRIWSKNSGWEPREYNGSNPHDKHVHVNSDFTQSADNVSGVNYRLGELVMLDNADKTAIRSIVAEEVSRNAGNAVWNYYLRNPYNDTDMTAGTILRYVPSRQGHLDTQAMLNQVLQTLAEIGVKVDLEPAEIEAVRAALDVPTPEENAAAVVAALGGVDVEILADALKTVLGEQKTAELKNVL